MKRENGSNTNTIGDLIQSRIVSTLSAALREIKKSKIHPTAIIEDGAELGEDVIVGAYAYIGEHVSVGDRCHIHHHATVDGRTELGPENEVFPYALIGGKTHDLKYVGGNPGLIVGANNVFREYVTVHAATADGDNTIVGNHNHILAYSHVAHDCVIGDHLVMSSHAALGGHVILGDHVNIGWGAGLHQFVHVGSHVMVGACSKVVQDIAPYMLADGNPAHVRFINRIGLERNRYSPEELEMVRSVFKIVYRQGLNRGQAQAALREHSHADHPIIQTVLEFMSSSDRGLA